MSYRNGVLIDNWYEDRVLEETHAEIEAIMSQSDHPETGIETEEGDGRFMTTSLLASTTVAAAVADGETARSGLDPRPVCLPSHLFFGHSGGQLPVRPQPLQGATLNALTLGEHLSVEKALEYDGGDNFRGDDMSQFVKAQAQASVACGGTAYGRGDWSTTGRDAYRPIDVAQAAPERKALRSREISMSHPSPFAPPPPLPPAPPAWLETRLSARR